MSIKPGLWILGTILATVAVAGCKFDASGHPHYVAPDVAPLPDATVDASDLDGGGGCTETEQRCYGTNIELCSGGQWTLLSPCEWGCTSSVPGFINCGTPLWSETVNMETDVSTGIWVASTTEVTTIDTDSGDIYTPSGPIGAPKEVRVHPREGLASVTIIGFNEIQIPYGARVEVRGSAALALVAYTTITIGGELIAQGRPNGTGGPGGYAGGTDGNAGTGSGGGQPGDSTAGVVRSGGGGGGNADVGGPGGTADPYSGGLGGALVPIDPTDGPLIGGSGGGSTKPVFAMTTSAPGGGGGGAVMLAAQLSVHVLDTGVVNAGGGGGTSYEAGGGGGAGGMVLIQTNMCIVEGVVAANGGGGGDANYGGVGPSGSPDDLPTLGGGDHGGTGGAGSALSGGSGGDVGLGSAGGGGGGAGFIRFDTVTPPDIGMGTISPHEGTAGHAQNAFPLFPL